MRVRAMGPSVCANWSNCFLTRLQMKKLSSIFQWKQKKKNHSEWKSFSTNFSTNTQNEGFSRNTWLEPTNRPRMCTKVTRGSQLTDIACAQRRPTEVYWLASRVHRGGSQKPTDQPCMCTEAISILFCMTLKAKESLKCCSCPLSKCGMPKLHITLNPRYTTLVLYPWYPPHVDSKGKVPRIVKSKRPLQDCSSG